MSEISQPFITFGIYFLTILFELIYYSIIVWVVLTWVVLFGAMKPSNKFFQFFTQIIEPILKPFRWARMGALDLSPIVAILALGYIAHLLRSVLIGLA